MHARQAGQLQPGRWTGAGMTSKPGNTSLEKVSAGTAVRLAAGAAAAGRTRNEAFGPQAVQTGSSSINATTPAQATCRAAAVLTRRMRTTAAVPAAINAALTTNSNSRCSTSPPVGRPHGRPSDASLHHFPPSLRLLTNASNPSISRLLSTLASTIPLTSSSTEPWQNRSMIWRTARAARLRAGSTAR